MVTFVNLFLVAYSDTAIAFFGAYFKVQQLIVMTVNGLIQAVCLLCGLTTVRETEIGCTPLSDTDAFGLRYDDTGNIDRQLLSGAAFGIIYSVGSHVLLWNIRYANYGGKLSVLRSLYHDFHLFSGDRKSRFQHSDSIMQTTAFPCSCLMVSGQIIPTERNLVCISCCGNRHYARCSRNNGMASPQKYLIICSKEENDERHFHERETCITADFIHVIAYGVIHAS